MNIVTPSERLREEPRASQLKAQAQNVQPNVVVDKDTINQFAKNLKPEDISKSKIEAVRPNAFKKKEATFKGI